MTHKKKKMIKRNHKKLSPKGKKVTAGAASVLLGTGLMMSAHVRPVKASSREDEISEVENVNVLSTEKAKVRINVKQRAAVVTTSTENDENQNSEAASNLESQASPASLTNENLDNGDASPTETKTSTYEDAADKVEDINDANDSKLQDAIDEAEEWGIHVEKDPNKVSTTVGDIEENQIKVDQDTDEQIKKIQEQIDLIKQYWDEHPDELKQYENQAKDEYIDRLIALGLLKDEDREEAKKGELGQRLFFDLSNAHIDYVIPDSKKDDIVKTFDNGYVCSCDTNKENIDGEFLKVVYTGLNGSNKYGETQIGKIEVSYSDLVGAGNNTWLHVFNGSIYQNIVDFGTIAKSITVSIKLYDTDDRLIDLHENTAYINLRRENASISISDDENHQGTIGKDHQLLRPPHDDEPWIDHEIYRNTINVSGNSIKIIFTSSNEWDRYLSGEISMITPSELIFNIKKPQKQSITITPDQLVLNPNSEVHIHYVDVNGLDGSTFSPDQGTELEKHKQTIDNLAVGDTYNNVLWEFEKENYVLATDEIDPNVKSGVIKAANGHYYVYLKHGTENVDQQQKVDFVVHHQNSNGASVAEDQVFELAFNRTATRDKVNGNISGSWTLTNPQILSTLDSSVMNNLFGAGKIDPSTGAVSDDVLQGLISSGAFDAVMVHATETPETPTNPGQDNPTSDQGNVSDVVTPALETSSTPTSESEEATPETDDEVSFPPEPEEVFGTYPHQPKSDEDETEESVTPHAQENLGRSTKSTNDAKVEPIQNAARDANPAPDAVSTQAAEVETESRTTRHADEATLPETGEEQSELATIFSMLAAALGITGLAGTSKRRKKDK